MSYSVVRVCPLRPEELGEGNLGRSFGADVAQDRAEGVDGTVRRAPIVGHGVICQEKN